MSHPALPFDPTASLTSGLVELIDARIVSDAELRGAAMFALDAISNIIGGLGSPDMQAMLDWARSEPVNPGRKALVLGAASAVLEMDAMHRESSVHAGTNVVPAVLAMTDGTKASGQSFLTALLKGSEAAFRIGRASGPAHYKMYQTSATCGVYGAALASAWLLGLDKAQAVHALGNAGTQSSGLWEYRETGAATKQLHAGSAAEGGVVAAQLAAHGFTGPLKILEGNRGFFRAACPDARPDAVLRDPQAPWGLGGSSIKPWPSSRHTHPAIDAALGLADAVKNRRITSVEIETYQTAVDLCSNATPASPHQGKSSLQYCVAVALGDGRVDLGSFTPEAYQRHRALAAGMVLRAGKPYDSAYPKSWGAGVKVVFEDGAAATSERASCKGDPEAPLSDTELKEKARGLLVLGGVKNPEVLMEAILRMADGGPVPVLPFFWN
ncbi:MAG TPA: MmgE/PrpD family protein [Burkholderiales bacterium]|nr:MmgE/PrpD family protein [Burkholderiales bacterium]